ncbi:cytochrome b5-like [Canna indica]|uniref:Cytochrome b5-like n=1 Tax=Canna indica TaxID=4628 RepID=A0AAQ3QHH1_9LILI|nr:cytochrome b5-like [Canna indica]
MGNDEKKVYTYAEVSTHKDDKDCWLAIDGKVYDVTKFLLDHPGGPEILLASTGIDATSDFEDIGHSSTAKAMMDDYYIGDIDSATIVKNFNYTEPKQLHYNQDKTPEFIIGLLKFLVPLAIMALAVGVRKYSKSS